MGLTRRQQAVLEFVERHIRENGYPPTLREIGGEVGISSTSVVNYNLDVLQKKGLLVRAQETSRGLRLVTREAVSAVEAEGVAYPVPLAGFIAAGEPLRLPETDLSLTDDEAITFTRDILTPEPGLFPLKVKGHSMVDALINDGDIVILRRQSHAENGDMVAAWLIEEGESTLKRFCRESEGCVRLQPANPTMMPIFVHPANLEIKGRVVAAIRHL